MGSGWEGPGMMEVVAVEEIADAGCVPLTWIDVYASSWTCDETVTSACMFPGSVYVWTPGWSDICVHRYPGGPPVVYKSHYIYPGV